ncbi:SMC family ATPase [Candidatus Woesearchaeota archaeon]|nr:MAG: SMC family ATPase [Candidatus Woesearchaeota archaeon]
MLRSLRLRNIRSYVDEEVSFPEGSVILSGDVGSGKSTILLAIEFALFGILRGEVSGAALLRHGAQQGWVELAFEVDGREVVVRRGLKRSGGSVTQGAGFLIVDGVREEATAVELKSRILSLLGYPEGLLAKSKSLLFRYTVYTPQQEMNRILSEKPEERLETLRKIFDLDKYKRVNENAIMVARALKGQGDVLEGQLSVLERQVEELKPAEKRLDAARKEVLKVVQREGVLAKKVAELKKRQAELEKQSFLHNDVRTKCEVLKGEVRSLREELVRKKKEHDDLLGLLKEQGEPKRPAKRKVRSGEAVREALAKVRHALVQIEESRAKHEERIDQCRRVIERIKTVSSCPTCLQNVPEEHRQRVVEKQELLLEKAARNLEKIEKKMRAARERVEELEEELQQVQKAQEEERVFAIQLKSLEEKKKRLRLLAEACALLEKACKEKEKDVASVEKKLAALPEIKGELSALRQEVEKVEQERREVAGRRAGLEREAALLEEQLKRLELLQERMQSLKKEVEEHRLLRQWLQGVFQNVIFVIERQLLMSIYHEFNAYFKRWFSMLIDESVLGVRLDEHFSPCVEQNGFETDVAHLSGGERSAVALAYRLALNSVISQFMSSVKTRGLLILDEPTDGFSAEQLDRLREVLSELKVSQLILVSHESKVESFVDHVLRVEKLEHVSRIVRGV